MKIYFKRDVDSVLADGGVYKKGSVHDVPLNDAVPFIQNGFAEPEKEKEKISDPIAVTVKRGKK